ncbi:hypothetical protein [Marinilabilia salmonicolor]|uniref:hypothetical protein n=1 Tax=Marinilabilia salmonicolor TaxID=989 RepID=UPI00029A2448|nr:hypothetical protein [Marinilabilia salmonicolor]
MEKSKGQTDFKTKSFDILSEFANSTSKVVQKAADILEEEVAAGVIAAKQVEEIFVKNNKASSDQKALINRFRKDAHELLDVIVNILDVSIKYGTNLTDKIISMDFNNKKGSNNSQTPVLEMPNEVKPGEKVSADMTIRNEGDKNITKFDVFVTELINSSGNKIASTAIKFKPVNINLKPSETKKITIEVNVPKNTAKGSYSGLLQANSELKFKAILLVNVV